MRLCSWLLVCGLLACKRDSDKLAPIPFSDSFERAELGESWSGDPAWRIRQGQVHSAGSRNSPLWLKAALPDDAVIELDARSESPAGDIKFEIYGDGKAHASGYILIFGGWNNTISCIARLDEHGADRQEISRPGAVEMGKRYRMKVVRKGKVLRWYVDGKLLLDYYDSDPLRGQGHDRLAFNNWESQLYFDNLEIRAATAQDE
ncbi:MAG: hypothetical protein JXR96_19305 [Deltaproteobacteria bacterium]|nr:hypothetical protein [Deltaproteobacteria bacterium]